MSNTLPPGPLAYAGTSAIPMINKTFDPTTSNYQFAVPTIWTNTSASRAWILVSKPMDVANWVLMASNEGDLSTITTPDSTVVVPTDGNINFLNGTNMTITGSGSDITFNSSGGGSGIVTLDGNTGSATGTTVTLEGVGSVTTSATSATVTISGNALLIADTDSGTATVSSNTLTFSGSGAATTSGSGSTVTVSVPTGGGLSLTTFGSTPNADGLTLTSGVLNMQPASGTEPGGVSTTTQTFAGAKTFSSNVTLQGTGNEVGTITSGNWNGSDIPLAYGGTSASLTASNGGIFYSTASAGAILSGTATAKQMLQSGSSSAPAWSTATWPSTTTADAILYSSATNTVGQISVVDNGVLITSNSGVPSLLANSSTAGYILTANSGAPPSWQAATGGGGTGSLVVNFQTFIGHGTYTYTPSANLSYAIIQCQAAGGGGGGAASSAVNASVGGGGGGGGYDLNSFSAATIGSSQSVVIGTGGAGGVGNSSGTSGGSSSVGSLISCTGGGGGSVNSSPFSTGAYSTGGAGGTGTGGILGMTSASGGTGGSQVTINTGAGGASAFGAGAISLINLAAGNNILAGSNGVASTVYGSGGSGAYNAISSSAYNGGAGQDGVVIITEFIGGGGSAGTSWSETSGTFNAVSGNGYSLIGASTATLPTSPSIGNTIIFQVDTASSVIISANTGQIIRLGNQSSSTAGTLTNSSIGDGITVTYSSTNSAWIVRAVQGDWTLA